MKQIIEKCDSCHSEEECQLLLIKKGQWNSKLMFLCNYCQTKKGFVVIERNEPLQAIIAEQRIISDGRKKKKGKRLWGI